MERFYLFQKFWNKTKTFWCVSTFFFLKQNVSIYSKNFGTKPKRFDVLQNLKWNVSIYSKNFGTKPKLLDVFQLFCSKSKTLLVNPKILRSERERFGWIMNFVSKTNIFDFFEDVSRKTKANDLCWFDITNYRTMFCWYLKTHNITFMSTVV
jgi:hypothetical protein